MPLASGRSVERAIGSCLFLVYECAELLVFAKENRRAETAPFIPWVAVLLEKASAIRATRTNPPV